MGEIKPYYQFKLLYSKDELLGSGGFGQVFSGRRLADNLPVAVKEIDAKKCPEWAPWKFGWAAASSEGKLDDCLAPLEIEMTLRAGVVDGVIQVLDVFDTPDQSAFVMVLERPRRCIDLYDFITNKR